MATQAPECSTNRPSQDARRVDFTNPRGEKFWGMAWMPEGEVKACIVVLHGMGSAATEFEPLGGFFRERGIAVLVPNIRANGHDPDPRGIGHFLDADRILEDLEAFLKQTLDETLRGVPLFLFGESMGALLGTRYLASQDFAERFAGCIFSSPVVELARPTPPVLQRAMRFFSAFLPRFVLPPALFIHGKMEPVPLTRNPAYQEFVQISPHRVKRFTLLFLVRIGELMEGAKLAAPRVRIPALVLCGGNDVFIRIEQVERWFSSLGSSDKTLKTFPEAYHLLLHDLDAPSVLECMEDWILERIPARPHDNT